MSVERRRMLIEPEHSSLSVVRQCELVSISRSGFYYQPAGETAENLARLWPFSDRRRGWIVCDRARDFRLT